MAQIARTIRQKFTSKERDNETNLDYFGARYYASTQGRFTGADPYDIAAFESTPHFDLQDEDKPENLIVRIPENVGWKKSGNAPK